MGLNSLIHDISIRAENFWYGLRPMAKCLTVTGLTFGTLLVINRFIGIRRRHKPNEKIKYKDLFEDKDLVPEELAQLQVHLRHKN